MLSASSIAWSEESQPLEPRASARKGRKRARLLTKSVEHGRPDKAQIKHAGLVCHMAGHFTSHQCAEGLGRARPSRRRSGQPTFLATALSNGCQLTGT